MKCIRRVADAILRYTGIYALTHGDVWCSLAMHSILNMSWSTKATQSTTSHQHRLSKAQANQSLPGEGVTTRSCRLHCNNELVLQL